MEQTQRLTISQSQSFSDRLIVCTSETWIDGFLRVLNWEMLGRASSSTAASQERGDTDSC